MRVVPKHRHEQLLARALLIRKRARARRGFRRALSRKHQPAYKPGSVRRDFSRAAAIPLGRRSLIASSSQPEWRIRRRISVARCHSYSALLPVGFAVPRMLPPARWALTPPFHPYSRRSGSGLLSVALSLGSPPPDVIRHRVSVEPGLSSAVKRRPPGRLMREMCGLWRGRSRRKRKRG